MIIPLICILLFCVACGAKDTPPDPDTPEPPANDGVFTSDDLIGRAEDIPFCTGRNVGRIRFIQNREGRSCRRICRSDKRIADSCGGPVCIVHLRIYFACLYLRLEILRSV